MTQPRRPARYPAWGTYFMGLTSNLDDQVVTDKLNISRTMLSRWMKGSARPDIGLAKDVATKLGGNPEEAEKAIRADSMKAVAARKPATGATKSTKSTKPRKVAATRLNTGHKNGRSATPDGAPLDRIRASRDAFQKAEQALDDAVGAARDAGLGWPEIASALG